MSNQASLSNTTQRTRTAIARGNLVLQRYRLDACLGQGGMGEVWRGHHEDLELPVAIKFLANIEHEELMARFRREAMLMARVRDENIVRILDFGAIDERTLCIVMELLSGQNLEQWMETHRGVVPWDEARRFGVQLMHGLAAMHEEGIIHRDIKPSNVMLVDQTHQLKIVDFGIAKPTDPLERLTQTGMLIGTPAYMAPEQLLGLHATETTDIYATGLILYEMLSGTLPFGDTISAIMRRLREPTPALEAQVPCPERLCRLVMWMLEKNPERRPNTGQVIAALEALETLAPRSIDLKRPSAPPTPIQPRPKTPVAPRRFSPDRAPHRGKGSPDIHRTSCPNHRGCSPRNTPRIPPIHPR